MPHTTPGKPADRSVVIRNELNAFSPGRVQEKMKRNRIAPNGMAQKKVQFECNSEMLPFVTRIKRHKPTIKIAIVPPNTDRQNDIIDFTRIIFSSDGNEKS